MTSCSDTLRVRVRGRGRVRCLAVRARVRVTVGVGVKQEETYGEKEGRKENIVAGIVRGLSRVAGDRARTAYAGIGKKLQRRRRSAQVCSVCTVDSNADAQVTETWMLQIGPNQTVLSLDHPCAQVHILAPITFVWEPLSDAQ